MTDFVTRCRRSCSSRSCARSNDGAISSAASVCRLRFGVLAGGQVRLGQIHVRLGAIGRVRRQDAPERAHGRHGVLALERQSAERGLGFADRTDRSPRGADRRPRCAPRRRVGVDELGELPRRLDVGVVHPHHRFERRDRAGGVLLLERDRGDHRVRVVGAVGARDQLRGALERGDRAGAVLGLVQRLRRAASARRSSRDSPRRAPSARRPTSSPSSRASSARGAGRRTASRDARRTPSAAAPSDAPSASLIAVSSSRPSP